MDNVTFPQYLYFAIFKGNENVKVVYFLISISTYFLIIVFNVSILMAVLTDKSLHEQPMYLLMCCLLFNSLYGSSALFPRLSTDLLSNTHAISRLACSTQIFVIYTYAISEYTILTVMAYDRYVAICEPLRYHSIMTKKKTLLLLLCDYSYAVFSIAIGVYLSANLPLCGNKILGLYCSNWSMVRLSCVSTVMNNIYGYILTVTTVFLPAGFILFTYIRILIVCRRSTSDFRGKALQTCLPHIVSFVTYSCALFSDIALSRYEPEQITAVAMILSLEYIVIPPLLNPLLYGLNLPDIRRRIFSVMLTLKCSFIS